MGILTSAQWRKELPRRLRAIVRQARAAGYTHILAGGQPNPVPLASWAPGWNYPMTLTREGERIRASDDISGGARVTFYWLITIREETSR